MSYFTIGNDALAYGESGELTIKDIFERAKWWVKALPKAGVDIRMTVQMPEFQTEINCHSRSF